MDKDPVKKIDEEINNLLGEEESVKDTDVLETIEDDGASSSDNTVKIDKIEDIEEKHVVKEKEEEIKKDDVIIDESKEEKKLNKKTKKSHKKKIIIICFSIIIVLLIACFCIWFFMFREKPVVKKVIANTELSEKQQKSIINTYGNNMEAAIAVEYMNSNTILNYDDAIKLVHNNKKVECSVHEIYDDGKVYLDDCTIKGKSTTYTYGKKQEKKPEVNTDGTVINVYVNKTTKVRYLKKPDDTKNYVTYTVNTGITYTDVSVFKDLDYVVYFDENYVGHAKNFKTDTNVLPGLDYSDLIPIKEEIDYSNYMAFKVGEKWGIYNILTGENVVPCVYDYLGASLNMGVSGPSTFISPLVGNSIAGSYNQKLGIINYTNNSVVIPLEYESILKVGNYLDCSYEYGTALRIFDFYGNEILAGVPNKYGMTSDSYIYTVVDNNMKLLSIDGSVIYDFGEVDPTIKLNFYYKSIIQFIKDAQNNKCVEYSYDKTTKKGKVLDDIDCGGIAKPILYLYPKKKTDVKVTFENPEILETTYPKYINGWKVSANKNGDLYDKDNKYYYGLYWDEKKVHSVDFSTGFYVEKDDAIEFLEEKLDYIGLNKKERNEFIMYWLPYLEKNGKSLVYFELTEERESYNKINISPKPDSLLRIVIHIKKVDEKVSIKKEKLEKFDRHGFSAVEWGGTTY